MNKKTNPFFNESLQKAHNNEINQDNTDNKNINDLFNKKLDKDPKTIVSVYMEKSLLTNIKEISEKYNISVNGTITTILDEFFKKNKESE